jgi:hypothetical protein
MEAVVQVVQCTFAQGKSLHFQVSSQRMVALPKTDVFVVAAPQTLAALAVEGA